MLLLFRLAWSVLSHWTASNILSLCLVLHAAIRTSFKMGELYHFPLQKASIVLHFLQNNIQLALHAI